MPLLDLEKSREVASEFDKYVHNGLALYNDCQTEHLSVTDYFEKLDPSEKDLNGKMIAPIDALERHLLAKEVNLYGPNALTVAQLSDRVEYVMPELVLREIKLGMEVAPKYSYKDIVAMTVPNSGIHYHPLYIPELNNKSATARRDKSAGTRTSIGKGGNFPVLSIRNRVKDIVVEDIGRVIETAYSVIKDHGWADFAILLRLIGGQMAADKLQNIYDLAITGDGSVGAARNTFTGVAGTLGYTDLVINETDYESPFTMNTMLCPQQSIRTILVMAQFQDPQAGWDYQRTGQLVTPMGAKLKQVDPTPGSTPTGTIMITMDKNFAVKEVVSEILAVEAEKIIQRKFEAAVVSEQSTFSIIADGALRRIIWT